MSRLRRKAASRKPSTLARSRHGLAQVQAHRDSLWLWLAKRFVFPTIRKKMVGENLKALICGSAPLTPETQDYFSMLGIPVLQVYGLTETTGICTMDDPRNPVPARVGPAISGIEMRLADNDEIIVRGPNIFPGYWNRPQQTAEVLRDGWFHTGDQGELDRHGHVADCGAPQESDRARLRSQDFAGDHRRRNRAAIAGARRSSLSATAADIFRRSSPADVSRDQVQSALDAVNPQLPHYKQVRAFVVRTEPFSIDNGMLTANGKLKRDFISARMNNEIDEHVPGGEDSMSTAEVTKRGETMSYRGSRTACSNLRCTVALATKSALCLLAELESFFHGTATPRVNQLHARHHLQRIEGWLLCRGRPA